MIHVVHYVPVYFRENKERLSVHVLLSLLTSVRFASLIHVAHAEVLIHPWHMAEAAVDGYRYLILRGIVGVQSKNYLRRSCHQVGPSYSVWTLAHRFHAIRPGLAPVQAPAAPPKPPLPRLSLSRRHPVSGAVHR